MSNALSNMKRPQTIQLSTGNCFLEVTNNDEIAVNGELIEISEANRLTEFVRKNDPKGLADLQKIVTKLLSTSVNAVLVYLPPNRRSQYGWAVYRNNLEWQSYEETRRMSRTKKGE